MYWTQCRERRASSKSPCIKAALRKTAALCDCCCKHERLWCWRCTEQQFSNCPHVLVLNSVVLGYVLFWVRCFQEMSQIRIDLDSHQIPQTKGKYSWIFMKDGRCCYAVPASWGNIFKTTTLCVQECSLGFPPGETSMLINNEWTQPSETIKPSEILCYSTWGHRPPFLLLSHIMQHLCPNNENWWINLILVLHFLEVFHHHWGPFVVCPWPLVAQYQQELFLTQAGPSVDNHTNTHKPLTWQSLMVGSEEGLNTGHLFSRCRVSRFTKWRQMFLLDE